MTEDDHVALSNANKELLRLRYQLAHAERCLNQILDITDGRMDLRDPKNPYAQIHRLAVDALRRPAL